MSHETERPTNGAQWTPDQSADIWATSLRPETPLRKGRGVWAYVRVEEERELAYVSASTEWLDVDMTAEACRHAVERAPEESSLTIHIPFSQRWVVEGLHGPVDKRAAERGIRVQWEVYCASQDRKSKNMERARKIAQLGVAAWRLEK
jgi:hypothetical protein